jgi:hypothetical protein
MRVGSTRLHRAPLNPASSDLVVADIVACRKEETSDIPLVLAPARLADLLGIHPATLRRMRGSNQLPVRPLSLTVRPAYSRRAIETWLCEGETGVSLHRRDYRLLTTADAAALLGIGRATAYRRLSSVVRPVSVGTELRFPVCRLRAIA